MPRRAVVLALETERGPEPTEPERDSLRGSRILALPPATAITCGKWLRRTLLALRDVDKRLVVPERAAAAVRLPAELARAGDSLNRRADRMLTACEPRGARIR